MKKPRKTAAPAKKTLNPFEVHINKQKMTVLGQKTKNDRGLPGVSRAKALKKRKQTLLQEYKVQHKSNQFNDKRIGERSKDLSAEDKSMARFAAIRKKAHKKSIFNLADDEVLTHKGQTLAEIEKFDDPRSDDDDESLNEGKSGNLDSNFVEDAHFGGGILTKTGKDGAKTHKELIDELIAESKKRKAEQQKTKEATLELTKKLDTEWKDLLPLVSKNDKKEEKEKEPVDDYDKVMRELRFEARGTVSDRLKTEDEIAKEEKEKLEELERERQERMKGFEEEAKKPTHRSADDLDDDFVYEADPEYMLSYNQEGEANVEIDAELNGKKITDKDEGEEEEDGDEEEEGGEEEESEAETESDDLSDLKAETSEESEEEEEKETEKKKEPQVDNKNKEKEEMMEKARQELPYTFQLPDSYEDLQKHFKNQSSNYQGVIVERMIKCNHPSLAESNKPKLRFLFAYLLQYLNDCANETSVQNAFEIYSILSPHFFDLAQLDKVNAFNTFKEVMQEKHEEYKKHLKKFPSLEVLIFLKLISLLFPTSDFRHQVVTPCFVFIERMLNKCRVKTRKDIAYGLFLVTLVLEYTTLSKRYLPAAINFLGKIVDMALPKIAAPRIGAKFDESKSPLALFKDCSKEDIELKMQLSDLVEEKIDDSFKIRVIYTTLKLLEEFDNNFSNLPSNVEIFSDILLHLEMLPTCNYPKTFCELLENVITQLNKRKSERKLEYIVMAAQRPKALRLYEPKIEEVFDGRRRKVQSKEKAERDKLLHKLKRETKGALREIRRDKAFLGKVKLQKRIQSDNERREKVKRIYAEASIQQSELNALDRKKKRK